MLPHPENPSEPQQPPGAPVDPPFDPEKTLNADLDPEPNTPPPDPLQVVMTEAQQAFRLSDWDLALEIAERGMRQADTAGDQQFSLQFRHLFQFVRLMQSAHQALIALGPTARKAMNDLGKRVDQVSPEFLQKQLKLTKAPYLAKRVLQIWKSLVVLFEHGDPKQVD